MMFNKFKQIKDKALQVKETITDEVGKASQDSDAISEIIQKATVGFFKKVKEEGISIISDEARFVEAVDTAYDSLPFHVKIVLRRKRFHKLMGKLADKYLKDKTDLTDQRMEEIIANEIKGED